jgi:uncharacterized protein
MPTTATVTRRDRSAPVRTCIGCRRAAPAQELVRVVLVEGQPKVDARRGLPGRGAWLHPSEACARTAVQQGAFARAFRCRVVVASPADLLVEVTATKITTRKVTVALVGSHERNGNPE